MIKKKCAIIIPGIPFPPIDGHKLKAFNLIKILSKYFNLHIIVLSEKRPNKEELEFIQSHSYKYKHFKINRFTAVFKTFICLFSALPFQVAYFTTLKVKKYLKKNTVDDEIVVLNLIRTTNYLDVFKSKVIVFDMVDSLAISYLNSRKRTSSRLYKIFYGLEAKRLFRYEKEIIKKVNLTLCVNKNETQFLSKYGNVKWIPNGVNNMLFDYQKKSDLYKDSIAFFGTMYYQPNIDAMLWFDNYVMDHVDKGIKLFIIGANPSKQILQIAKKRKNVIITGFLDDPYLILNSCMAVIAPMQTGGGIQNKILETMALGKLNIVSRFGANPIQNGKDGVHFIIEDDPIEMAEKINNIHSFPGQNTSIGYQAKELIQHEYTWSAYEKKLIELLNILN